ncbi:hypothetical protein [Microbacterium sp.]|uniref:hypothetical protein n=1 Tax=Microbacterium sp. TaxID=51671 RepID=UPI001ACEA90A|nr:hypothetical protein [Microbacterium sp.]MBN9181435.1 hypothetical protein [Microbacterium sp.]MBN9191216.1 hypothetical protein [Microbacterium sp.]
MTATPSAELDHEQDAIDRGYAEHDRDDMAPTIRYFEELLAVHPGNARLNHEVAGECDTAGREAEARVRYEEPLPVCDRPGRSRRLADRRATGPLSA